MKRLLLILSCLFLSIGLVTAQTTSVTGVVVDNNGEAVIGASVLVKGTQVGTATDVDGNFSLNVPADRKTLVISFIGMDTKEVAVASNVRVVLNPNTVLEDLVVIGYGTVKKSELTGAVGSVNSEQIKDLPVASVAQALQGKVSGLQISSSSGRAGDATQVSIRGVSSITASTDVLYVIDGVPVSTTNSLNYGGSAASVTSAPSPMSAISVNDIESIEVLKDAASAAIYGSRASNGVILITTKGGKFNQKTQVSISANIGIQELVKKPKLLNAQQYINVHNAARENYEADIAAGRLPAPTNPAVLTPITPLGYDTDWIDLVLRSSSIVQDYQVSVSGADDKTSVYFGAGLFKQQGALKNDEYTRANLKLNVDRRLASNVKFGARTYLSVSNSTPIDEDNNVYQPWSAAMGARPDSPAYDENGKPVQTTFQNPLWGFQREISDKWLRVGGSAFLNWTILEGLIFEAKAGGNIGVRRFRYYDAANTRRGENAGVPTGYGYYATAYNPDYIYETTMTYSSNAFDNRLHYTILGGLSYQRFMEETSYLYGENYPSTDLHWLYSAGKINNGDAQFTQNALASGFARIQLSWDNKYNLMMSVRRDGSSKFYKDSRWDNFFAFSGGWTVSNENFFPKNDYLSTLKLRLSYGQTGQQGGIGNATGQNLINSGDRYGYYGNAGLGAGSLFNPNIKWESQNSTNFGLDFSFLKNRIDLSLNYYIKNTKDLIYNSAVPHETGYRAKTANVGELKNSGIEIDLSAEIMKSQELSWDFNANFTYNKNELTKLSDDRDYFTTGFVSIIKKGYSIGAFTLIKALGVAQEDYQLYDKDGNPGKLIPAGDMIYEDINGDGQITDADQQVYDDAIAPIFGGFGTTLRYKGFDFQLQAEYSIGSKVYRMGNYSGTGNMNGGAVGYPSYSKNMFTEILDYWTPENRNTDIPRVHLAGAISTWNNQHSTRFLEDADYLKIKSITLGYTFNTSKMPFIKTIRVYLQANNLLTFTPFNGLDPEVKYTDPERANNRLTDGVDSNGIPNRRSYNFGLNLTF